MPHIDYVLESFTMHHPDGDTAMVLRAYELAKKSHEGQVRRSGEPYIIHPVSVAKTVADMGLCEPSICAALLHDVVEDTPTTIGEINAAFGDEVSMLVDGLTKLDGLRFAPKEEQQAENIRKMLVATVHDIRVLLIKLADRLHNMTTLGALPPEKQERIAQETRDIYIPLAGRLGLAWLKAELDDLAFRYLESEAYNELYKTVRTVRIDRVLFIDKVKKLLTSLLREKGLPNVEVSGRIKNLYSIYRKMRDKDLEVDQVHDAIAFRVICDTEEECYAILGYVHARWTPVPGLIKDYIAMPKPNRYQSLHTTVVGPDGERMEIQIRTRKMHEVAEYGIAAHWAYKEARRTESDQDLYRWLREVIENQATAENPREFFDSVKFDLVNEEVYVFTPAGEVVALAQGATPLDFAYAIHTEVGNHCKGARINGKLVPFDTSLRNGDHVEILTSPQQRPTPAWLDIAKTARARTKIKAFLRAEQRRQSTEMGRALLDKALRKRKLSLSKSLKSGALDELATRFKQHSVDGLFAAIAYGKLDEELLADALVPQESRAEAAALRESTFEKVVRRVTWNDDGIVVDGVDNLLVHFAQCCTPLPGEPVIGYISRGRGIVIHTKGCQQASLLEKDRQTKVQWAKGAVVERPVTIRVTSANRPGVLAAMTNVFVTHKINLSSVKSDGGTESGAVTEFVFPVRDIHHLRTVMRALRNINGVQFVQRITG